MPVIGLTLGKFAPLHLGHQFLIESALKRVDKLLVVIYECDELPACPLPIRAAWLTTLYPQLKVILAPDGPKQTGYSDEITSLHDQYLQNLLKDFCIDYFFSSEPYGRHVSQALNCQDFQVDSKRLTMPISGTKIRQNIIAHQEFLSPLVFNALMTT